MGRRCEDCPGGQFAGQPADAVRERLPAARLLLVGSGPLDDALKAQAATEGLEDAVSFAGDVPQAELPAYYSAAYYPATTGCASDIGRGCASCRIGSGRRRSCWRRRSGRRSSGVPCSGEDWSISASSRPLGGDSFVIASIRDQVKRIACLT